MRPSSRLSERLLKVATLLLACAILAEIHLVEAAQSPQKTVLVLITTRRDAPASTVLDSTIRAILHDGLAGNLDYHTEYLDATRFPEPDYQLALRDFLRRKYVNQRFDVVVATSDGMFDFVDAYRDEVCPGAAVVFLTASPRSARNSTGVVSAFELNRTLDLANHLHPDLRRVFVVTGESEDDRFYANLLRAQFRPFEERLEITYSSGLAMPELLRKVAELPPRTVIYFLTLFEDVRGGRFVAFEAFNQIAAVANAPIYHWTELGMGYGMVGGSVVSIEQRGRAIAHLALRVLKGESPESIPVQEIDAHVMQVDWRQLKRWNINEQRLPAGSLIRFREPSLWDQYRVQIVGATSVILLQTALIAGLLVQGAKRRRVESALRESHGQNRDLAGRLIHAQELERARIARELHDDVGQRVASLSIGVGSIRQRLADAPQPIREELLKLQRETVTVGDDLRLLSHELHPAMLEHLGLIEALQAHCEKVAADSGISIALQVAPESVRVPHDVALCFYRVAQEALRNVVSHAQARSAKVSLTRQNSHLAIRVADDGRGFEMASHHSGLGLVSMDERIRMLGGTLTIESSPRMGTTVSATVPVGESD